MLKRMKANRRKTAIVGAVLVVIVVAGWMVADARRLKISPTEPRGGVLAKGTPGTYYHAEYDAEKAARWFDSIEIKRTVSTAHLDVPCCAERGLWEKIEPPAFQGTEVLDLASGGRLELAVVGVYTPNSDDAFVLKDRHRFYNDPSPPELKGLRIYDAEMRPIPAGVKVHRGVPIDRDNFLRRVIRRSESQSPGLTFCFHRSNITNLRTLSYSVFDARTGQLLHSPRGESSGRKELVMDFLPGIWHSTPLRIHMSFMHGPMRTARIPLEVGAGHAFPEAEIRIMHHEIEPIPQLVQEDGFALRSAIPLPEPENEAASEAPRISRVVLFAVFPPNMAVNFQVRSIHEDGSVGKWTAGTPSAGFNAYFTQEQSEPDIREIEISFLPWQERAVYTSHSVPMVPGRNGNLPDLLDVHIPYARVDNMHAYHEFLSEVLLLKVEVDNKVVPARHPAFFTGAYENFTPRQLLREYRRYMPPHRVEVDYERGRLQFLPPPDEEESIFKQALMRLMGE